MARLASTAYAHEIQAPERLAPASAPQPFEVVVGGGLDAQVRQGVTPAFLSRVRTVVLVLLVLIMLGAARVAITTGTVGQLRANMQTRDLIKEAEVQGDSLRIDRSVLTNPQRISRIVADGYNLTLTDERIAIDLSPYFSQAEAPATLPGE